MNKNLLALSVAAASAMAFSASAAVSSNIVGYVKLNLAKGYSLVANPLNNTNPNGNTIGSLFGQVSVDVLRWTGTGFQSTSTIAGVGVVDGTDFTLAPGEAVFVFNGGADAQTATMVGEALTGTQTVAVGAGNSFVASKIPIAGTGTELGLTAANGFSVLLWNGTTYVGYDYVQGLGYLEEPQIAVGQGLVVQSQTAFTWSKTFTPAP